MVTAFRLIDDDEARCLGIDVEECERDAAALLRGDDAGWVVEVPELGSLRLSAALTLEGFRGL